MTNTNQNDDVVETKIAKRKSVTLTAAGGASRLTILAQRKAHGAGVVTVTTGIDPNAWTV